MDEVGAPGPVPEVTILMGLYNGARHIEAQLDSLAAQDHPHWRLVARDDGSVDGTPDRVAAWALARPDARIDLGRGPGRGAAANYLHMLAALPENPGWLAFADQDDVWLPDRLSRGLAALAPRRKEVALYCTRSLITTDRLEGRRLSPPRPRPASFRNALVQNIAAGNTQLLTPPAAALLRAAAQEAGDVVVHDWWAYQIVTGAGGTVVHDDHPTILYRQHEDNQIGANDGWQARIRRLGQVADGTFRGWNDVNMVALRASAARLTPEARRLLDDWDRMRHTPGMPRRLWRLARLGLYRQTLASTLALWLAAVMGRL
ncbi:MAG: glycosyltransferase [Paracoccaceae bacterium]|nr:MAG: glycosyltransferase [Paracoccaceae bacterium]